MTRLNKTNGLPFVVVQVPVTINVMDVENLVTYWMGLGEELPRSRVELLARVEDEALKIANADGMILTDEIQKHKHLIPLAQGYVRNFLPSWYEIN